MITSTNLQKFLNLNPIKKRLDKQGVLIIDDEADQASVQMVFLCQQ